MALRSIVFAFTLLLATMVSTSHQLKCFKCYESSGLEDTNLNGLRLPWPIPANKCGDFNSDLQADCADASCIKAIVSVNDAKLTVRNCVKKADEKVCTALNPASSIKLEMSCFPCSDADGCNSAALSTITFGTLLLPIVSLYRWL